MKQEIFNKSKIYSNWSIYWNSPPYRIYLDCSDNSIIDYDSYCKSNELFYTIYKGNNYSNFDDPSILGFGKLPPEECNIFGLKISSGEDRETFERIIEQHFAKE